MNRKRRRRRMRRRRNRRPSQRSVRGSKLFGHRFCFCKPRMPRVAFVERVTHIGSMVLLIHRHLLTLEAVIVGRYVSTQPQHALGVLS